MENFKFEAAAPKIERTHSVSGKIVFAESYSAKSKEGVEIPGVAITIEGVPYALRLLKGSVKGASTNPGSLLGCEVIVTGIVEPYQGKDYFRPKDLKITKHSTISKIATAGVSYSGSLD